MYAIKENTDVLLVAGNGTGLEVNADETKYRIKSRDQNTGRNHRIETDNSSFERLEQFKYLGTTVQYQHTIQGEIKKALKSGIACYNSVLNLLSSICYPKMKRLRYTEL